MRTEALKFKTIVVTIDPTQPDSVAFRYAQELARIHLSTLVVVHVVDPVSYAFPTGTPDALAADQAARDELNRIEEDVRLQGIAIHSVTESGTICERILYTLKDHNADLLVLGTRAKSEAGRVALGTVARQLLANAPCAVLTVPPGSDLPRAGQWRRVLVATDFSAASLSALRLAQSIVLAQLFVLHAEPGASVHNPSHCLEHLRFLAPLNESHTVPVDHIVAVGEAGEVIAEHARNLHADLVVIGCPDNEISVSNFHTSTAWHVISRVSCPVLCVPLTKSTSSADVIQEIALAC